MRIIDISQTLNENTAVYPSDTPVRLTKHKNVADDYYNAYLLQTGLHAGTHIDMPLHFLDNCPTADSYPAERFISKCILIDVRGKSLITAEKHYHDLVPEGSAVLLYTGHDLYYPDPPYFSNHPKVCMDFAEFLIKKNVPIIGMDMPSPDGPPYNTHKFLLANNIFVLENLTNLGALRGIEEFELITLPLKITAEASIVRAVCRVDDFCTDDLITQAHNAKSHAYAPYSGFMVGAALETSDGTVYCGCNIENSTYGATICGERTAIAKAVSEGHRSFKRLAVVSSGADFTYPCGICRQMLVEFSPDCEIILTNSEGALKKTTARELLPEFFLL